MKGVNKVILVGAIGNDPETRFFPSGGQVTNISVATNEQWTDKQSGEKRSSVEWHRVQFGGKLAEIAGKYLKKGSKVYIEGKLQTRKYDKNGETRYVTEIHAFNMQMLDSRSDQQSQSLQQPQAPQQAPAQAPDFDDINSDIPF